ncbi:MAG: BrnT family toxin [Ahrensia sp.]|nr:BrnT family toxin [Ahrensia sp.]
MRGVKVEGIQWDEGNWPKCGKHGVSKLEVELLFRNDPAIIRDDAHSQTESRFKAIGQTAEGRDVFVIFTLRCSDQLWYIRPISARYMHAEEVRSYEKQREA